MYTLVSAIGVKYGVGERWASVDIGNTALNVIYQTYRRVIVTLSNPYLPENVGLDLDAIKSSQVWSTVTFNQYLTNIGAAVLPTVTTIPTIDPKYAQYRDAFLAGYTVEPIAPNKSLTSPGTAATKTDLYLKNPNIAMSIFYASCMVTVNGFFHFVTSDGNAAYVRDGDKSRQKSNFAQCGILCFNDLGTIEYVDLNSGMLYYQNGDTTLPRRYRTYFDIGTPVGNKIPILVLGGYLHILDDKTFKQVGTSTFMLDMENYPMLNRYYESLPYLDWSGLNLPSTRMNAQQVGVADILSDTAIAKYFDMSQTFMVLLDAEDIFVDRQWIRTGTAPGKYLSGTKPIYPLVTGYGRMCEYWVRTEDKLYTQYSLSIADGIKYNYVFNTVLDPNTQLSVGSNLDVMNPAVNSPAFFKLIGRDVDLSLLDSST